MKPEFREELKQAVRDLLKQGTFGTNDLGGCCYASEAGTSCIAGLFFKNRGVSHERLEALPACGAEAASTMLRVWLPEDYNGVLDQMQMIHDRASRLKGDTVADMLKGRISEYGYHPTGALRDAVEIYLEVLDEH